MKKRIRWAGFFYLLPLIVFAGKTAPLQVRDIWTLRPLVAVQAVVAGDTVFSDRHGFFHFPPTTPSNAEIIFFKKGYFSQSLSTQQKAARIIYLIPVASTEAITVVQSREVVSSLALPSNVSRIEVKAAAEGGLQTLNDLLGGQEGLFIKSYGGSGQLQTLSIRGMSAEQTQVLLDGIPLNNLQLGSADLSQYDLDDLSTVAVYRGGNALLGGSAGAINLLPDSIRNSFYLALQTRFASFRNRSFALRMHVPVKGLRSSLLFKHTQAGNHYPVLDGSNQYVTLQNRDFNRWQFILRNYLKLNKNWSLHSRFSVSEQRGGAPKPFVNALSEAANKARKSQKFTLAKIKLRHAFGRGSLLLQTFVRNEWMRYDDPLFIMNEQALHSSHFNQLIGFQSSLKFLALSNFLLHGGAQWYGERINSSSAGRHARQRSTLNLNGDYQFLNNPAGRLSSAHLNIQLRVEHINHTAPVILPAAALSISSQIGRLYATYGKNYRPPSFNDLYWQPGGNPQLRPERSQHAEAGYEHTLSLKTAIIRIHADLYANLVSKQIKWLPGELYWSPQNIASVFSRGLEWRLTLSDQADMNRLTLNYTYGRAEKNQSEYSGDHTVGHQLPFLPREQIFIQGRSRWQALFFGLRLQHVSFRYLTLQNKAQDILKAYTVGDLWLGLRFDGHGYKGQLSVAVQNLFDLQYQIISGYPMPPRNFSITLKLNS